MITVTYSCDQCTAPIGELIRITATTPDCEKHFCSAICLSAWMTGRKSPSPFTDAQLGGHNSSRSQDAVQRKCDLCGRVGTRRFVPTDKDPDDDSATGWRCAPSASSKCPGNRPKPAENMPEKIPATNPIRTAERTVREIVEGCFDKVVNAAPNGPAVAPLAVPEPPHEPIKAEPQPTPSYPRPTVTVPVITARCSGCTRTWNLTGRQLEIAVSMHEHRSGHVVDIEENENA